MGSSGRQYLAAPSCTKGSFSISDNGLDVVPKIQLFPRVKVDVHFGR